MKLATIIGLIGRGGVAMVKDKKGKWSPLAFVKADEASLGFQFEPTEPAAMLARKIDRYAEPGK